jgi:hypothetical protein
MPWKMSDSTHNMAVSVELLVLVTSNQPVQLYFIWVCPLLLHERRYLPSVTVFRKNLFWLEIVILHV